MSLTPDRLAGSVPDRPQELLLREGVDALGLTLADAQIAQLLAYLALLAKWSRVYNLTAVRDPAEMLTHHLLDSLAVIGPLARESATHATRLLDVGSGAGLPGVVIAICRPDLSVDCVDAVGKKAAFVQQVAAELRLTRLRGVHSRVEDLAGPYDIITSRAFASLADFVGASAAALAPEGVWLAMKGKRPEAELAALPPGVRLFHVEHLEVPGLRGDRCIVWLKKPAAIT